VPESGGSPSLRWQEVVTPPAAERIRHNRGIHLLDNGGSDFVILYNIHGCIWRLASCIFSSRMIRLYDSRIIRFIRLSCIISYNMSDFLHMPFVVILFVYYQGFGVE